MAGILTLVGGGKMGSALLAGWLELQHGRRSCKRRALRRDIRRDLDGRSEDRCGRCRDGDVGRRGCQRLRESSDHRPLRGILATDRHASFRGSCETGKESKQRCLAGPIGTCKQQMCICCCRQINACKRHRGAEMFVYCFGPEFQERLPSQAS